MLYIRYFFYLFDKFIVPDLAWSEKLFAILAYLKEKTYKPSSLTNELRTIFMKAYVKNSIRFIYGGVYE